MRRWLAGSVLLALLALGQPAAAYMVEVTTAVDLGAVTDQGQLEPALQSAVEEVLHGAIAFTPTLVLLTRATVVGQRLYLRLLIADRDGERTLSELAEGEKGEEPRARADVQI